MKKCFFLFLALIGFFGCQTGSSPINYGKQGCHYCSMTIVDKQHAAQIVTKKGKVYSFDATECMINYTNKEKKTSEIANFYVCDYKKPESLINAKTAIYLISEKIPSPMGAFLSAFNSREEAKKTQYTHQGKIFNWDEIIQHLKK